MDEFFAAAIAEAEEGVAEGGIPIGSTLIPSEEHLACNSASVFTGWVPNKSLLSRIRG